MSDNWQNINTGMKVELENHLCDIQAYWIATVVKVSGTYIIGFINFMNILKVGRNGNFRN